MESIHIIAYDIGTTSVKTCLFNVSAEEVVLLASAGGDYPITVLPGGGAEQDPDDWWRAMCDTTRKVTEESGVAPVQVDGLSFCSQMQGLVLVDKEGRHVRPAMSYMDQRATEEMRTGLQYGPKIEGANVYKLLRSLAITKAAPTSVKDPVWKYKWVRENEPENFAGTHKWLDVKEAIVCRCTGNFVMTPDSAYATLLYDTREGKAGFSREMCRLYGVDFNHLPEVIGPAAQAGTLTKKAAEELGLAEGTPVFGGGGDASLIGVGAGATSAGATHIYVGTSGWVITVVEKQLVDTNARIAAIVGADKTFNYFAEMETAGKCMEWVRDHLALDEIGIYLEKHLHADSPEAVSRSLYDYLIESIKDVPPGSGGVLFVPWLHGNRCPFEDSAARGMFFNIGIETGKSEMIRAVLEGICFHLRWMLEAQGKRIALPNTVRFVGGGALAPLTCQILADITGKTVQTVKHPQNVGAVGAALLAAVGLKIIPSMAHAEKVVSKSAEYTPNAQNKAVYDKNYSIFQSLYRNNKKAFRALNG